MFGSMISKEDIEAARARIEPYITKTPLVKSTSLSKNNKVYLKLENRQKTNSFKVRGALNKILSLSQMDMDKKVITASTGNHGLATAYALSQVEANGTIFLPSNVNKAKLSKLEQYSVDIQFHGEDGKDTETYARSVSENEDRIYISPYNDPEIIAGQGTIGIELLQELSQIDYLFITVGGGGLISGIASYVKQHLPNCKVIGCLPLNSPVMYESIRSGKIIELVSKDTLSDGSAGGIEPGSITFDLVKELVDDYVLVTEKEIARAIREIWKTTSEKIEGAAGVSVAAYEKMENLEGNVVILLCGGNIDDQIFQKIVNS